MRHPHDSRRFAGQTGHVAESWIVTWLPHLLLLLICVGTYSGGLSFPFIYDDALSIVENPHIRRLQPLTWALTAEQDTPTAGRPVANLSFAVNYALRGLDVYALRATNLALHAWCACLLYALIRRTLAMPGRQVASPVDRRGFAFAAATLWAVHPLNTEVVQYVTQRTEVLWACCLLGTLVAATRAVESPRPGRWHSLAVACCGIGMGCKESMVIAPLVVLLHDWVYCTGSLRDALRIRRTFYLALASTWGILVLLLWSAPRGGSAGLLGWPASWTYLLNQSRMLTEYMRHVIWPVELVSGYGWMASLTFQDVAVHAVVVSLVLMCVVIAALRAPRPGVLGVLAVLPLAPTSSLIPIVTEVGAERRMYVPLMALAALAIAGSRPVWVRLHPRARRTALVVAVAVAAGLVHLTTARIREYVTPVALYQTVVDRWPTHESHHILGSALLEAGARDAAIPHLRHAIAGAPRAHYDLGVALLETGHFEQAVDQFRALEGVWEGRRTAVGGNERGYRQWPVLADVREAQVLAGRALILQGRWSDAVDALEPVLRARPAHADARRLLGLATFKLGDYPRAVSSLETYLTLQPQDVDAITNLGIALLGLDRADDALVQFRRAAALDAANGLTQRNLAMALLDRQDADEAEPYAARAVQLRPDDPEAFVLVGRVHAAGARWTAAAAAFRRAIELAPGHVEAQAHLEAVSARDHPPSVRAASRAAP